MQPGVACKSLIHVLCALTLHIHTRMQSFAAATCSSEASSLLKCSRRWSCMLCCSFCK